MYTAIETPTQFSLVLTYFLVLIVLPYSSFAVLTFFSYFLYSVLFLVCMQTEWNRGQYNEIFVCCVLYVGCRLNIACTKNTVHCTSFIEDSKLKKKTQNEIYRRKETNFTKIVVCFVCLLKDSWVALIVLVTQTKSPVHCTFYDERICSLILLLSFFSFHP